MSLSFLFCYFYKAPDVLPSRQNLIKSGRVKTSDRISFYFSMAIVYRRMSVALLTNGCLPLICYYFHLVYQVSSTMLSLFTVVMDVILHLFCFYIVKVLRGIVKCYINTPLFLKLLFWNIRNRFAPYLLVFILKQSYLIFRKQWNMSCNIGYIPQR